jgi:ketosteroid isomerase-like protein
MRPRNGTSRVPPVRCRPLACLVSVLCLTGAAIGCAGGAGDVQAPVDENADRRAVLDAHTALVEAYEKGDVDAFVLQLDKSDDLLIWHPRVQNRWTGIDEIQRELPKMFARLGESSWLDVHLAVHVNGDVAWLTSQVVLESPGIEPFTGRSTEIWKREGHTWRLTHAHWSENPEF